MAPVSKLLVGGVAVAILQGCGDPKKDKTSDSKLEVTDIVDKKIVDQAHSNIDQIVVDVENIVENFVGNVGEQGVEKAAEQAASNAEDLQKKSQQIWNAVMSKKGGAIAAGVALTGTVAAAIGYKVKQHRAQAGRTCTVVGEGVSNKFVGLSYNDGQKVKFECATGYTLITDEEVTVECDANGKARISACSKNSLVKRFLGDSLVNKVGLSLVLGGSALWWYSRYHKQKAHKNEVEKKVKSFEAIFQINKNHKKGDEFEARIFRDFVKDLVLNLDASAAIEELDYVSETYTWMGGVKNALEAELKTNQDSEVKGDNEAVRKAIDKLNVDSIQYTETEFSTEDVN